MVIKNAPKRIWLQIGDDDPESFDSDDFHELADDGQVTWCADNQYDADIKFIRADISAEQLAEKDRIIAQLLVSIEELQSERFEAGRAQGRREGMEEATEAIDVLRQTLLEVAHAQQSGSEWYTKGHNGLYQQVALWVHKGADAIKNFDEIRKAIKQGDTDD